MRARYVADLAESTVRAALATLDQPALVFALVAEASAGQLPHLQRACAAAGCGLLGGLFPALHRDGRFEAQGAWLAFLPADTPTALVADVAGDSGALARALVGWGSDEGEPPVLFLLFDTLVPNIASLVGDLYLELADSVRYVGVCAGSETFQPTPCLFDLERIVQGGFAALRFPASSLSDLAHGYRAPDDPLTATSATGHRVATVNWRAAFEVYREKIAQHFGVELTRENFYQYAVHFPVGISLANGEALVRIPVGLDDAGALFCVGEVPENSLLILLEAPPVGSAATVDKLVAAAKPLPDGERLVFYCAGRRLHFGERAVDELHDLAGRSDLPLGGAVSLGEIGCVEEGGYPYFHNGALVCLRWPGARP